VRVSEAPDDLRASLVPEVNEEDTGVDEPDGVLGLKYETYINN
jgi:hypothetical protein